MTTIGTDRPCSLSTRAGHRARVHRGRRPASDGRGRLERRHEPCRDRGQGSVWLRWFIHVVLTRFAALCRHVGQGELAEEYERRAERLQQALNAHAWDGGWYLRAFYDDGSPLGSSQNLECQIDSIAQSWSVLSGAGTPERQVQAMAAVNEHLVRRDDQLIMLFTPPFDRTTRDPGYIKGYLPGIRENGGQYTHGAVWTVWAFAKLGQGNMAGRLYALLNPINHAKDRAAVERYHVEPYVVAADVYSVPPHNGRGGWTWYTGSARLDVPPRLGGHPRHAPGGRRLAHRSAHSRGLAVVPGDVPLWAATYHIEVNNPYGVQQGVLRVTLDSEAVSEERIPLMDDGGDHRARHHGVSASREERGGASCRGVSIDEVPGGCQRGHTRP